MKTSGVKCYPRLLLLLCLLVNSVFASPPLDVHEKVVTLATLDWPPYIGQSLAGNGYVYELMEKAFAHSGYAIKVQFHPWNRALTMAQNGEVDVLFPEYYAEERSSDFMFSNPFLGGPVGFYKHEDSRIDFRVDPRQDQLEALRSVAGYSIGVVRGYINTDVFDRAEFLKKEPVVSDIINLKKLYHKRVDLILIDKFVAEYLLNKELPEYRRDLEFLYPPLEVKNLYLAFSKKAPGYQAKRTAFNQGLEALKKSGELEKIYAKHGFREVLLFDKLY